MARGQAGVRAPRAGRVRRNEAAPGRGHRPSLARTTPHSHPRSGTAPREGAKPAARLPPASAPPGGEPHRRLLPEQKLCVSNGNRAARQLPPPPPPPPQLARAECLPREGTSRCTEDHARLHCRTGWGAAGVRNKGTRFPATPQGPARAQGGRPAASALSAPHPSPSCPHPTLPRLLPSQPTPAPRPPGGRRENCSARAPSGVAGWGRRWTLTAPPKPRPEQCAPPARSGPFILRSPPDPPPPCLGWRAGGGESSARPRPAPPPPGAPAQAQRCGKPGCGALDAVVRGWGRGWMRKAPVQLRPEPLPANSPRPSPAPRRTKI